MEWNTCKSVCFYQESGTQKRRNVWRKREFFEIDFGKKEIIMIMKWWVFWWIRGKEFELEIDRKREKRERELRNIKMIMHVSAFDAVWKLKLLFQNFLITLGDRKKLLFFISFVAIIFQASRNFSGLFEG